MDTDLVLDGNALFGYGTTEEKDVSFGAVDHVMDPSGALLDSETPPFGLTQKPVLRD